MNWPALRTFGGGWPSPWRVSLTLGRGSMSLLLPAGYPMPTADLPGCVHLTTSIKLAQIKILVSFSSVYFYGLHSEDDVPEITLKANNQA